MLEKNEHAKDCVEFVQYMHTFSFPDRDIEALVQSYPLPEEIVRCIDGKRIVLFHIGDSELRNIQSDFAGFIRVSMDYLRESLFELQSVFLWWYDDGLISRLIQDLNSLSKVDEAQLLEKVYKQEQQAFIEGEATFYDASGDEERVLAWADAYFGDDLGLIHAFSAQGKLSVQCDFASLHDGVGKLSLDEWLDKEVRSFSPNSSMKRWQEKVNDKRVLMYYLSAATLLHRGMCALDKILVLSECITRHDNLVVLWFYDKRIDDLLPCLPDKIQRKYQEVRNAFLQSGGLIDENESLIGALKLADVCYMDSSHSAKMFSCLDKKLIVSFDDKLKDFIYTRLRFSALYMDKKYIYFVPGADRGTFWGRMCIDDGKVNIKLLRDEAGNGYMTKIMGTVIVGKWLLIYPLYGRKFNELYLYSLENENVEIIKITNLLEGGCCSPTRSFRNMCKYKKKIFAGIWSWPRVIVVDLELNNIREIEGLNEAVRETEFSFENGAGFHFSCILNNHFYVLYYNHNSIFDIDAEQEKFIGIKQLKEDVQIRVLETDGEYLWLGTAEGEILRYDVRTDNYLVYKQRMPLYKNEQYFCNGWMIYHERALHCFCTYISLEPECLYTRFDIQSGEFSGIQIIEKVGWLNNVVLSDMGELLISSKYKEQNKVYLLDLSSMSIKEWEIKLSSAQESVLKQQILRDYKDLNIDDITEEVDDVTVKDFVDFCMTSDSVVDHKKAGRTIYEFVKGQI